MTAAGREFRASWKIVLASSVGFGCGALGFPLYTNGIFSVPLAQEFGWSMSALQTNIILLGLMTIVTMPVAGWLCDRVGSRPVAITSLIVYSISLMLLSQLDGSAVRYYGLWFLVGVSGAGTLPVVWTRVIVGWFDRARGLALGITLLGTGFTGALAPPFMSFVIQNYGWRAAYVCLGLAPLLIALPLTVLFFREREDVLRSAAPPSGYSPLQALRSYRFWVIGACLFLVTFAVSGLISNLVKILITGHGYALGKAAWIAGAIGIFVIAGRPLCGWLMDRFWAPAVAAFFFIAVPVACLLLRVHGLAEPFIVLAAAFIGLGASAEFDVFPFLISRYFGTQAFGTISGQITLFFCIAASIAPFAFARIFDRQGSYDSALLFAAALTSILPFLILSLGRYVYKADA